MDARKKTRIINEAQGYILENWIYTEPSIRKIKNQIDQINIDDVDLNNRENDKLKEIKNILSEIGKDSPGISFKMPHIKFSIFAHEKALPGLPLEIQKEIYSKLPFSERQRLSSVSSAWNAFFNEIPIEKEYIFPKKSGGLIFFVKNEKPVVIKEFLSAIKADVKSDIEIELYNSLSISNKSKLEEISKARNDGISAYYALTIPALFTMLLSYYFESNKMFYGSLAFLLLPLIIAPLENLNLKTLQGEPVKARDEAKQYLGCFKKYI